VNRKERGPIDSRSRLCLCSSGPLATAWPRPRARGPGAAAGLPLDERAAPPGPVVELLNRELARLRREALPALEAPERLLSSSPAATPPGGRARKARPAAAPPGATHRGEDRSAARAARRPAGCRRRGRRAAGPARRAASRENAPTPSRRGRARRGTAASARAKRPWARRRARRRPSTRGRRPARGRVFRGGAEPRRVRASPHPRPRAPSGPRSAAETARRPPARKSRPGRRRVAHAGSGRTHRPRRAAGGPLTYQPGGPPIAHPPTHARQRRSHRSGREPAQARRRRPLVPGLEALAPIALAVRTALPPQRPAEAAWAIAAGRPAPVPPAPLTSAAVAAVEPNLRPLVTRTWTRRRDALPAPFPQPRHRRRYAPHRTQTSSVSDRVGKPRICGAFPFLGRTARRPPGSGGTDRRVPLASPTS